MRFRCPMRRQRGSCGRCWPVTGSRPSVRQHGRTETRRVSRDNAQPDSSPETSAFRGLRAVRISPEAPRLLMSSCISAAGTVNQRAFGARGLAMRGETVREHTRDGRTAHWQRLPAGPPKVETGETSAHATPCRKTPYARRKTRTPRPGGQGVHSEPFGAPVSRAPLEVGRAGRVSNVSRDLARRRELDSPPWRAQNRVLDLSTELDRRVGLRVSQRSNRPSVALQAGFRIAWTRRDTVDGSVEVAVTSMVEPLRKGCAVTG